MRFLIVRLSSMGDIGHTLPLINGVKQIDCNSKIDWVAGKSGYELLKLIPDLDTVYTLGISSIKSIQKQNYDYVIDVQGLFKSALISKLSFGKKIVGFKKSREFSPLFYDLKIDSEDLFNTTKHIVDLNLKLLSCLENSQPEASTSKIKFSIPKITNPDNESLLKLNSPSVVIFPATTWKSKLWPMKYWYELIKDLSIDFSVYLCASNGDLVYIQSLLSLLDNLKKNNINFFNLTGKTSFKDLIYLIQNTDLVIGLDSFGIHLASAIKNDFGKPDVIGIYGPTSPVRNGPYNLVNDCFYLSSLVCIACRKKRCPFKHHACMNNIYPEEIKKAVYSKLKIKTSV